VGSTARRWLESKGLRFIAANVRDVAAKST
jgi:Holliday junction resolvase-like predicted endonuclease